MTEKLVKPALAPEELTAQLRTKQQVMLEIIKRKAGPLVGMMPSANMRDRARKIYELARELQNDLTK